MTGTRWYRWECSDTQQYKMLGNGWTVEVIKHILSFLPETARIAEAARKRETYVLTDKERAWVDGAEP